MSLSTTPHAPRSRGFTLVEALVAVAVVGVLATVALPAYSEHLRRGMLPEAFGALADFRARMEQYYQDNGNYGQAACADTSGTGSWSAFAATEHFAYSCTTSKGQQAFAITATGLAGPVAGHVFTIDQSGDRGTTQFKGVTVAARCWLTASGNTC